MTTIDKDRPRTQNAGRHIATHTIESAPHVAVNEYGY